ncbi:MAG: hypothetical protein E7231_00995 [Cellulosilyticum sp.]|nr:hypothetical protein [Cellulosilyticum sp.]
MKEAWKVIILACIFLYEFAIYPKLVYRHIQHYVKSMNGQTMGIEKLSRREALYLVEYKVEGKKLKSYVRCDFLGGIIEWR